MNPSYESSRGKWWFPNGKKNVKRCRRKAQVESDSLSSWQLSTGFLAPLHEWSATTQSRYRPGSKYRPFHSNWPSDSCVIRKSLSESLIARYIDNARFQRRCRRRRWNESYEAYSEERQHRFSTSLSSYFQTFTNNSYFILKHITIFYLYVPPNVSFSPSIVLMRPNKYNLLFCSFLQPFIRLRAPGQRYFLSFPIYLSRVRSSDVPFVNWFLRIRGAKVVTDGAKSASEVISIPSR